MAARSRRLERETSRAASDVECDARVSASASFLPSQPRPWAVAWGKEGTVRASARGTPGGADTTYRSRGSLADVRLTQRGATMRAAVFVETGGDLVIEDLEPAPPGPKDVVVQLGASGVCHSDLSIKNGYVPIMPGTVLGH